MNSIEREKIFGEIYDRYFRLIVQVAYSVTGNMEVSEEMSQEAFLRYYERIERLPHGEEARYWLLRVVRNLCYNHEKRKGRESRAYQKYYFEPKPDYHNEGEKELLAMESRREVREALLKLPYNMRIVLTLKEYSGLNYKEIGRILNISEGNVKIRVFRARQQLSEYLKKGELHVP